VKVVGDSNADHEAAATGGQPSLRALPSMGHHVRQLRHDAATLATEVQSASDDLETYVKDRARRHPYGTLGVAAGFGYVLGGGLRSPLTMMIFGIAARAVAGQIANELSVMAVRSVARPARTAPASPTVVPVT
jgi:ElaB/YqjD/DUF883 family membrane-anchored ribosome-binding protein